MLSSSLDTLGSFLCRSVRFPANQASSERGLFRME